MSSNNNDIWIALISSASTILAVLGIDKIIPSFLNWKRKIIEEKQNAKKASINEVNKLRERIDALERKLDHAERFETQTKSTLRAMLPLMKEMMREHPNYIEWLEELENNIMNSSTFTDK